MDTQRLILIVEDSREDAAMVHYALQELQIRNPVRILSDGEQAVHYLCGEGEYEDRHKHPFPGALFLDLRMPRLDGFGVLQWLKDHPKCNIIPVMVLSASALETDVQKAYEMGANCFMTKPGTLEGLLEMLKTSFHFWSLCQVPPLPANC